MTVNEQAGRPADPSALVDVDKLVKAYYEERPDPGDAAQQVAFGTSGHRGSALKGSFNEAHILATTEAICRYREAQGIDGPLFLGRDTHALSEPAQGTALEVLAAHGVQVRVDSGDRSTPTPAAGKPANWYTFGEVYTTDAIWHTAVNTLLNLQALTGVRLNLVHTHSAGSLRLIRAAKAKGQRVTASVAHVIAAHRAASVDGRTR